MNLQSTFRDRLVEAYGTDKAVAISKKCDIPVSTLQSILAGSLPRVDNLVLLAAGADVDVGWLATGEDDARQPLDQSPVDAFPCVPRYDVALSAGGGTFPSAETKLDEIPFTQDFLLKRLGRNNTDGLILVDADGDSMAPTINSNDLVMVDTTKNTPSSAIYAFTYEDALFVKRLERQPDCIIAKSDNSIYDPFTITPDQSDRFKVIGRVVWTGRTF